MTLLTIEFEIRLEIKTLDVSTVVTSGGDTDPLEG